MCIKMCKFFESVLNFLSKSGIKYFKDKAKEVRKEREVLENRVINLKTNCVKELDKLEEELLNEIKKILFE